MFRLLHARRLTQHPLRTALSAAGIAIGTALIVAVLGMFGSLATSVEWLARTSGDADLEVLPRAGSGLAEDLVDDVAATPGVASAVPLVRTRLGIGGLSAVLLGGDQRAGPLAASFAGCEPTSVLPDPGGVVLGGPLAEALGVSPGDTVAVQPPAAAPVDVRVVGTIECDAVHRINRGRLAVALLPAAQRLTGRPDSLDSILVHTERDAEMGDVERALSSRLDGKAVLWSPAARVDEARRSLRPVQDGSLMVAVMAVVVAGFLVFNAMSMAALERRRELATLRALGGRRRRLLRNFLGEAALLGIFGSLAGVVIGAAAARRLVDWVPAYFIDIFGVEPSFALPPGAMPAAFVVGVGASVVAAWIPGRAAVRVDPVDAMKPQGVLESGEDLQPARRILVVTGAVLVLAATGAVFVGDEQTAIVATALVFLGVIVATAGSMGPLARAAGAATSRTGGPGRLASASLERAPRRAWATTMAIAMAVAVVVATGGLLENQRREFSQRLAPLARSDLFVQTASAESIPVDILMPTEWVDRVRRIPGVDRVVGGQFGFVLWDGRRVIFEALDGRTNSPVLHDLPEGAAEAVLDGDGVVLGRGFARDAGVETGDVIDVPTPNGEVPMPVVGVVDVSFGISPGPVVLSLDRMREWYGRDGVTWIEVILDRGADQAAVRGELEKMVAASAIPAEVRTGKDLMEGTRRAVDQGNALLRAMGWVIVAAAGLAVLNTLTISVMERRREIGILRAIGSSRRHVRRAVVGEALGIALVGAVIGVAVGAYEHWLGTRALGAILGSPVAYSFVPSALTLGIAVAAGTAVLGAIGPAWRAGNVEIVDAIGYE